MINKIHQTSKTKNLTSFQQKSKESILNIHKDTEYKLWDDDDLLQLSKKEFPNLANIWNDIQGIQRADLGRYMVLYLEGGLYTDTDVIFEKDFFKNLELYKDNVYFSPSVKIFPWNNTTMTNYIIYSPNKHNSFFKELVDEGVERIKNYKNTFNLEYVPYTTGRILVNDISEKHNNIKILDKKKINNKFCSSTEITDENICYHEGSTIRNDEDGSWRSSSLMALVDTECKLRKKLGIKGNICQVPVVLIFLVLIILTGIILFIKYK